VSTTMTSRQGWAPRPLATYMTTSMFKPTTVAARPTRPSAVDTVMMDLLRHTMATRSRVQLPLRTTIAMQLRRMAMTTMPVQTTGMLVPPRQRLSQQGVLYYQADFVIAPREWRMVATTPAHRLRWPPTNKLDLVSSSS
jgi:hypothetical protein